MHRSLQIFALVLLSSLAIAAPAAASANVENLIAPTSSCPNQNATELPRADQELAMHCLTNFARERVGLRPLSAPSELGAAASRKAGDILGCNSFSHQACGREFTYWLRRSGYLSSRCWRAGENIAWGTGSLGSPRAIFTAWMRSPGHRENILGRYAQIGISMRVGPLDGRSEAAVWVQEFGTRC